MHLLTSSLRQPRKTNHPIYYLVNEDGIIEKIFTPKEIKTKIHAEQILDYINNVACTKYTLINNKSLRKSPKAFIVLSHT